MSIYTGGRGGSSSGETLLDTFTNGEVLSPASFDGPREDFFWVIDNGTSFTGSSQTFYDPVMFLGWNVAAGASQVSSSYGSAFLSIEGDYWTNTGFDGAWHHQGEIHLQMAANADAANPRRVFTSSYNWALKQTATTIHGDYFNIVCGGSGNAADATERQVVSWNGATSPVYWKRNFVLTPDSGRAEFDLISVAECKFYLNYASGQYGQIIWQQAGTDKWSLYSPAGEFRLSDHANGKVALKVLPGASATAGEFQWGFIHTFNDSTLFQTTVGAAGGGSAVPATPTKYLKIKDNGGTTYVIPCYAAS